MIVILHTFAAHNKNHYKYFGAPLTTRNKQSKFQIA